jgi:hypothetical protein
VLSFAWAEDASMVCLCRPRRGAKEFTEVRQFYHVLHMEEGGTVLYDHTIEQPQGACPDFFLFNKGLVVLRLRDNKTVIALDLRARKLRGDPVKLP